MKFRVLKAFTLTMWNENRSLPNKIFEFIPGQLINVGKAVNNNRDVFQLKMFEYRWNFTYYSLEVMNYGILVKPKLKLNLPQ